MTQLQLYKKLRNPGSEKPKAVEFLKELFKKVKKAPSHYCRKQSSKIYLEPLLKNEKGIYRLYLRTVKDGGIEAFSFRQSMRYFNTTTEYALLKPKKDLCNTCLLFRIGTLPEEPFEVHIWLKH